jgi:hypothetical protein
MGFFSSFGFSLLPTGEPLSGDDWGTATPFEGEWSKNLYSLLSEPLPRDPAGEEGADVCVEEALPS